MIKYLSNDYCKVFGLTFLITLALTARSQHYLESGVVWWTNFLPVVAYVVLSSGERIHRLEHLQYFAIFVYLVFHAFHFWFTDSTIAQGVEFWPASAISFILITYFTFKEIQRCHLESDHHAR